MSQPDIHTQDPYSTQSYNRYAYAMNNPLKYNDPSGYTSRGAAHTNWMIQRERNRMREFNAFNAQLQREMYHQTTSALSLALRQQYRFQIMSDLQHKRGVLEALAKSSLEAGGKPKTDGEKAAADGQTDRGETVYIENTSEYVIFFKPEGDMTINGVKYLDDGAYALFPGQSWNYPVDGVKTSLNTDQVFKIPGKFGFNGDVTIDINGQVDLDFYGFGEFYNGWRNTCPETNWQNLWNSQPYKP